MAGDKPWTGLMLSVLSGVFVVIGGILLAFSSSFEEFYRLLRRQAVLVRICWKVGGIVTWADVLDLRKTKVRLSTVSQALDPEHYPTLPA